MLFLFKSFRRLLIEGGESIEAYKRFSEEQIDKANRIDIVELAKMKGYPVYKKGDELRIKDMGGLVLDKKKNQWFLFAEETGGGPIQFLMQFENMTWKKAVEDLLKEEGEISIVSRASIDESKREKSSFKLPVANNSYRHVFAYLVKTRLIHPKIVQEFVDAKLLYEDTRHNCVFVGRDKNDNAKYAALRGTYTTGTPFKGEVSGSNKRYGFSRTGKSNVLFVAEAPIDILSYLSIYQYRNLEDRVKDEHLLSLGCTADNALEHYLQDHPEIEQIKLGLDNDAAGNDGCKKIVEKYGHRYKVERINFYQKDMNEVLSAWLKGYSKWKECKQKQQIQEQIIEPEL